MSDWGSWYQGDILGNWVQSNSNLNSDQVRLNMALSDKLILNLIYYHFSLYSQHETTPTIHPVTSKNLADEIDLDLDVRITDWWTTTLMVGANIPEAAATEMTGGSQTWFQAGMWSSWTF